MANYPERKQQTDRLREPDETKEGFSSGPGRLFEELDDVEYDKILRAIPPELLPSRAGGGSDRRRRDREQREDAIKGALNNFARTVGGQNLDQSVREVNNTDTTDLSQVGALRFISEVMQVIATIELVQLETLVQSVSVQSDIASDVAPAVGITVSGVNEINKKDNPEAVIPNSQNTDIPTDTLHIRASSDNTDPIYFGDEVVDPGRGFILNPGESWEVSMDFRDDQLYMASETAGQKVQLLGVI